MRLFLVIVLLIISCDKQDDNFYFRYNVADIDEIDTQTGTIWRRYSSGKQSWTFKLTDNEQRMINDYAVNFKIKDIKAVVDTETCENGEIKISFPAIDHEFEFRFGTRQTTLFKWGNNDCDNPIIHDLQNFVDSLRTIILQKETLKDIRKTDILIL